MENTIIIKDTTANPAPLWLLGFWMTTVLLNIHNAWFFELNAMIMGMGIFVWWIAQVIAGMQERKKNNTFWATAFTAYGFFRIALVTTWILPKLNLWITKADELSMWFFLAIWGLFTLFMFIWTLKINKALQIVFGSLTVLFALLAIGDFTWIGLIKTIAGYEWIFCGLSAIYACAAQILNETYWRTILPLWKIK